ncbi:MAG: aspartate-semialdehyde dehydrogenase [Arsenophonus sp.]|nr:MAG: aspartate-semialdehyde dehydrogenase [Arsenophonus sp.]
MLKNKKIGFIGWRGMVGSVLLERMISKKEFKNFFPIFFSTSQHGKYFSILEQNKLIENAFDINKLKKLDIIVTCQGSKYTNYIHPQLRQLGWSGYWIDTASSLRMRKDSLIVLDPINKISINHALSNGIKNFIVANCTVCLMLMTLNGLFKKNLIDHISMTTYQAASGAGSNNLFELFIQIKELYSVIKKELNINIKKNILSIEKKINKFMRSSKITKKAFGEPLIGSLIPWIGKKMPQNQTYEEWKCHVELNKILNRTGTKNNPFISINSICVRVATFRCHSQSFFIKLNKNISINKIKELLLLDNNWVKIIPNNSKDTIQKLTPTAVSGKLIIHVGRLRKFKIKNENYLSVFSVGDQILWGSVEPLRRMLRILYLKQ